MPKRILVVENSDAVRGVAETVLRQNGYEVIGVADSSRAREVLDHARPDVMLVGADIEGSGQRPFFEQIKLDARTASIPTLIFADKSAPPEGVPAEVIVPKPFEPKELLDKVTVFTGSSAALKPKDDNPLGDGALEDDFLDAALGLDAPESDLDVTDSEVMDKTQITKRKDQRKQDQRVVGYDDDHDTTAESGRVEAIRIEEEQTDIRRPSAEKPAAAEADSDGLDILDNAYGVTNPDAAEPDLPESHVHDYHWFMNSLQNEAAKIGKEPVHQPDKQQPPAPADDSLQFQDNSTFVDPQTPGPGQSQSKPEQSATAKNKEGQVDKYIDEFKRELENLRHVEPEIDVQTAPAPQPQAQKSSKLTWEETVDRLNEEQLRIFTREFADRLAEKLAARIIEKIDTERLLNLLKNEIIEQVKSKARQ